MGALIARLTVRSSKDCKVLHARNMRAWGIATWLLACSYRSYEGVANPPPCAEAV